jgi:hypothetical protein
MAYTHPAALERVCDEVERTAWSSDRQFFQDHPERNHRLRPAMSAEVSADEIVAGRAVACPPGMRVFTAVKQFGPGIRARLLFVAPAVDPWVDPPEDMCRAWYDLIRDPQFEKAGQELAAAASGGQT